MSEGWVPSLRGFTFRFPLYPALSCRANECRPFGAGVCEAHSVSSPLVSFHLSIFSSHPHSHAHKELRSQASKSTRDASTRFHLENWQIGW